MSTHSFDIIIAGGGPAGLSAALMLGRARRRVLLIDATQPRNRFASHMHGVIGFDGASPQDLLVRGKAEAISYGVEFSQDHIANISHSEKLLTLTTRTGAEFSSRGLILASGVTDILPDIPGLAEHWGTKVLHCPYCHGYEVADQHLGVLATSELSIHQAELIRQWSTKVTLFTHSLGSISAEAADRLHARGIAIEQTPVAAFDGNNIIVEDGRAIAIEALFTFTQLQPNDDFVASLNLAREETPFGSFIKVDQMGKTSLDNIWAVGNVVNPAANVPVSMGAGSFAGAAANFSLINREFDEAVAAEI